MLHLMMILCDTILIADCAQDSLWDVTLSDTKTGKRWCTRWTGEQLSAILALGVGAVGEEKSPGYNAETLYEIAEGALVDSPPEVRPIP